MQRISTLVAMGIIALVAVGCERSEQPAKNETKRIESPDGDGGIAPAGTQPSADALKAASVKRERTMDVGCGKCMLNIQGMESCEAAVKVAGKAYEITGAYIDPTETGLCKALRKARVLGRLVPYDEGLTVNGQNAEFIADSIELQE